MALTPPETLSPSKVTAFGDCALAFRLSNIDKLPEEPSPAAVRGTLVHLALQHLLDRPADQRSRTAADADLDRAIAEMDDHPDLLALDLDADGGLIVTDYKTGRSPSPAYTQARLTGVHIYALLCHEVFGRLPSTVRLVYLGDGAVVTAEPTEQSNRAIRRRIDAVHHAVERACATEDFRPRPGPLCNWCSYHEFCPAKGGDLANIALALEREAITEAAVVITAS